MSIANVLRENKLVSDPIGIGAQSKTGICNRRKATASSFCHAPLQDGLDRRSSHIRYAVSFKTWFGHVILYGLQDNILFQIEV